MTRRKPWLDLMAGSAAATLGVAPEKVFFKTRKRMRGLSQYGRSEGMKAESTVRESGLLFHVNFTEYLDTGLFLDHRPARAAIRAASKNCRVLNLFSYTGSFSVYAAAGGAAEVTSVDLSNTYLAWSSENFRINGLAEGVHKPVKADVMEYLVDAGRSGKNWDIIIADPPTFSNSTTMKADFDVNRDWPALMEGCEKLLAAGGLIVFSTNSRQLRWDDRASSLPVVDISELSIPPDFRNRKIHRCWLLGNAERILSGSRLIAG